MSSPWWNLASTALGGMVAFAGVFWAQRKTGQREQAASDARYDRDRADRFAQQCRDVYLDMARYAQHRQFAVGRLTNRHSLRDVELPDLAHPDVLTAAVRVYAPAALYRAWKALLDTTELITSIEVDDGLQRDPHSMHRYLPSDDPAALCTHVACETLLLAIRTALAPGAAPDDVEAIYTLVDRFAAQIDTAINADPDRADEIVASLKLTLAMLQYPSGDMAALVGSADPASSDGTGAVV